MAKNNSDSNMNKDVGEVFQSVVENVRQKQEEGGFRAVLGSLTNRKKDKAVKRKFRQIEKGVFLIVGAIIVGYASDALFISKVSDQAAQVESEYRASQAERTEVQALISNQDATQANIDDMREQLAEVGQRYPNYRTENEILIVLNNLFASSGVSVSSITVTPNTQVQKAQIGALISQKGLTEYVEGADYFTGTAAAGTEGAAAASGTSAAAGAASGDAAADGAATTRETKFDVTEVTFSVSEISRDQALELSRVLYDSDRILIPRNLSVTGDEDTYALQGTLFFYSYRISEDTESLV